MKSGYELRNDHPEGITEMVITGGWSPRVEAAVLRSTFDRLVLNYALGFSARNLDFLVGLPVSELQILARTITDIRGIYGIPHLELLIIDSGSPVLECDRLPHLKTLGADWVTVADTIASAPLLERLVLSAFTESDLEAVSSFGELKSLVLNDRPRVRALDGLERLAGLARFEVSAASQLEDVSALGRTSSGSLSSLSFISVRKVTDWESALQLHGLRELQVAECGDVRTLNGIDPTRSLQRLDMHGSTRIVDGDLSPLLALAGLRDLRLMSRRVYRPSVADVKTALGITG